MEYKPINGYDKEYKININGEVLSLLRNIVLKPFKRRHGYKAVKLKGKTFSVHRLVAEAFIPNPDSKPCVNHKNGIKTDNSIENLEWVTQRENMKHSFIIGKQCNKGESHPRAKITLKQSVEIKELIKEGGMFQTEIAKKYNISPHLVSKIKKGKLWNY